MSRRYDDRDEMNAIQRDRYERRRYTRRKSLATTILFGVIIVAIIAAITIIAVTMVNRNKASEAQPATETAVATTATEQTTAAQAAETQQSYETAAQQATQQQIITRPTEQQTATEPAAASTEAASTAPAPAQGGTALHYYANGKTSYGYDWTYSGGAGVVAITCNYNFDNNQYDFVITGVSEGTTSFILYYNTDDNTQVPVSMSVSVDSGLNVTQL